MTGCVLWVGDEKTGGGAGGGGVKHVKIRNEYVRRTVQVGQFGDVCQEKDASDGAAGKEEGPIGGCSERGHAAGRG